MIQNYQKFLFYKILILFGLCISSLEAGFATGTLIYTPRGIIPIEQITIGDHVYCVDQNHHQTNQPVVAIRRYKTNNLYHITINNTVIICDIDQLLYIPLEKTWRPAKKIKSGQNLLTNNNENITIKSNEPIHLSEYMYDLSIQDCHNFFVSEHKILVHNFVLTIPLIAFGSGEIVFLTGAAIKAVVGGILGSVFWNFLQKSSGASTIGGPAPINFNQAATSEAGAQAPGIPTENDGYIPPKNWDGKKVKNPNGPGVGWPDKNGRVWVPSGPKGHGGPHWDVQSPRKPKDYDNIYPGGKKR